MRRIPILLSVPLVLITAACEGRPPEFGVSVFSNDTTQATISLTVTGGLVMGLRAEQFIPQPDKSLLLVTPAELLIQKGRGGAVLKSVHGQGLVVRPIGLSVDADSKPADTAAVVGTVVAMERPDDLKRKLTLKVERP